MNIIEQKSSKSKTWFDLTITDNGDGTNSIPAGSFWLHGKEYSLPKVTSLDFSDGLGSARTYIEKVGAKADYYFDNTGRGKPVSFGEGVGAPRVAWNYGGEINILKSVGVLNERD